MISKKIIIAAYNPEWPNLFFHEKTLLIAALNEWDIAIEHIGSTAIPSLSAKPVIDILMGVSHLTDVNDSFIKKLQMLGYEYVPEYEKEIPERRYFRKNNADGVRTHQIHVCAKDSEFWHKHIFFRDYLRKHSEVAQEYEKLKRALAEHHTDTQEYARAKTDFVHNILNKRLEK